MTPLHKDKYVHLDCTDGSRDAQEGLEVPLDKLPPWQEKHVKTFPVCWKNPVTGHLHFQVHPSGIQELVCRLCAP